MVDSNGCRLTNILVLTWIVRDFTANKDYHFKSEEEAWAFAEKLKRMGHKYQLIRPTASEGFHYGSPSSAPKNVKPKPIAVTDPFHSTIHLKEYVPEHIAKSIAYNASKKLGVKEIQKPAVYGANHTYNNIHPSRATQHTHHVIHVQNQQDNSITSCINIQNISCRYGNFVIIKFNLNVHPTFTKYFFNVVRKANRHKLLTIRSTLMCDSVNPCLPTIWREGLCSSFYITSRVELNKAIRVVNSCLNSPNTVIFTTNEKTDKTFLEKYGNYPVSVVVKKLPEISRKLVLNHSDVINILNAPPNKTVKDVLQECRAIKTKHEHTTKQTHQKTFKSKPAERNVVVDHTTSKQNNTKATSPPFVENLVKFGVLIIILILIILLFS